MALVEQGDRAAATALVDLLRSDSSGAVSGWLEENASAGGWMAAAALSSGLNDPDLKSARRDRALRLLNLAKDHDPRAVVYLAAVHRQQGDEQQAVDLARQAAKSGNVDAMGLLASWLRDAIPEEALFWENTGFEHGDVNAVLARAYRVETIDPAEAARCYEQASANATGPVKRSAPEHLAWLHHRQGDERLAGYWYERAALAGSVDSMRRLAGLLFDTDLDQSIQWFRRAAEAGDRKAMVLLASAEQYRDPEDAARWLRRARDLGDDQAEQTLRHFPANGSLRSRIPGWSRHAEAKRARRRSTQHRIDP